MKLPLKILFTICIALKYLDSCKAVQTSIRKTARHPPSILSKFFFRYFDTFNLYFHQLLKTFVFVSIHKTYYFTRDNYFDRFVVVCAVQFVLYFDLYYFVDRSVFTIVRFLNIPCSTPNGRMTGVCFSANDCVRLQGTQIGTCASGFGVCCICKYYHSYFKSYKL